MQRGLYFRLTPRLLLIPEWTEGPGVCPGLRMSVRVVTEGRLKAVMVPDVNGVLLDLLALESSAARCLVVSMDTVDVVGYVAMQPHSPRPLRWLCVTKQQWQSRPKVEKSQACDNEPKLRNLRVGPYPCLCETGFAQLSLHVAGPRGGQFLGVRGT